MEEEEVEPGQKQTETAAEPHDQKGTQVCPIS